MSSLVGDTPNGWTEAPLAEVCDVLAGPSGSMIRTAETDGVSITVVAPKNLHHGRVTDGTDTLVTRDASKRLDRYRLAVGDLVLVRTGDLGKQALIDADNDGWVVGTACFRLRPGPKIDPRYLFHYLGHPAVRDWIERHASMATVPTLTLTTLRTLPVLIAPPAAQGAIGGIMAALDEKAALHREIVQVTEELRDTLLPLLLSNH